MRVSRRNIVKQIANRANEVARQIDFLCIKNENKNWTQQEIEYFDLYLGEWCTLEKIYNQLI